MAKPPLAASLTWTGDLTFAVESGNQRLTLDGRSETGPSPVQTLAFSIGGCMAMDVVDILRKGRHPITGLNVSFVGDRAQTPPHRFLAVTLHFSILGAVPAEAVQRAIGLSREKYCSVSNSLRGDIVFKTSFEVTS